MRGQREYRLEVGLSDSSDALVRVLSILRRRRCEIVRVDYAAGDCHRPVRLRVHVRVSAARASSLPHWVENAVDVVTLRATAC